MNLLPASRCSCRAHSELRLLRSHQAAGAESSGLSDAPAVSSAPQPAYLNNYRWQRQPAESASLGRIFPLSKESKVNLQIRLEFTTNLFNRLFLGSPSASNPSSPMLNTNDFMNGTPGALSSGFGFVNTVHGAGSSPRQGQLVARL